MNRQPCVYILASQKNGTLYIGVTSDLIQRVYQHKHFQGSKFTTKYEVKLLVHYECFEDMESAIMIEKRWKAWKRDWKIRLIEERNPDWNDLWPDVLQTR